MKQDIFYAGKENQVSFTDARLKTLNADVSCEVQKQHIEKYSVDLRKTKRSSNMQKRRCLTSTSSLSQLFSESFSGELVTSSLPISLIQNYPELVSPSISTMDKMLTLRQILTDNSPNDLIIETLEVLQSVLNFNNKVNSEVFISLGLVGLILKYMNWDYGSRVVLPATHCFLILSAESDLITTIMINEGAIEAALKVMKCSSLGVSCLALVSLTNLNLDHRLYFGKFGYEHVYSKIENLMTENKEINIDLYSAILFFMSSVINSENLDMHSETVPLFTKWLLAIIQVEEPIIIEDAVKVIYGLTIKDPEIASSGVVRSYLVKFPLHLAAIKALANMSFSSDEASLFFLENALIERLAESLLSISADYKISAIKCMNNILHSLHDSALVNLRLPLPISACLSDSNHNVRRESIFLLSNISEFLSLSTWESLIDQGLYKGLEACLDIEEEIEVIHKALIVVACLLLHGNMDRGPASARNKFVEDFQQFGLFEMIEDLSSHANDDISQFAQDVLNENFEDAVNDLTAASPGRFVFS